MRELTTHRINGLNESLRILAVDEPGAGGANHRYDIIGENDHDPYGEVCDSGGLVQSVTFQSGPLGETDLNGISNEALMAIVIDRLEGFQSGPYRCRENAIALTKLEEALHWLQHRTHDRVQRGVEGTLAP